MSEVPEARWGSEEKTNPFVLFSQRKRLQGSVPNGSLFPCGSSSKVVHYIGNRGPFEMQNGRVEDTCLDLIDVWFMERWTVL